MPWWTFLRNGDAKVTPRLEREEKKPPLKMWLVKYQTMIRRYGGQRHPRLDNYDMLKARGELVEFRYVPLDATTIYVSHECTGNYRPDHDGTQAYHLLRLMRRLHHGEIPRTDICLHADRRDTRTKHRAKTCYRTYRRRGWCVLEIFASYLSRDKTHPALLITSATGIPEWISPMEAQKLAVGTCDFTCCQRNHTFGDRITRGILETLIDSKVQHLFETKQMKLARLFHCMRQWWLRGSAVDVGDLASLKDFKMELHWDKYIDAQDQNLPWIDRSGLSILAYAVFRNDLVVVRDILKMFESQMKQLLSWRYPTEGVVEIGIPGRATCLCTAMFFSRPKVVVILLEAGACPHDGASIMSNNGLKNIQNGMSTNETKQMVQESAIEKFKKKLRWDIKNEKWFDYRGVGILLYATGSNEVSVVRELLEELKRDFQGEAYTRCLESRTPKKGFIAIGIPGMTTALMAAATLADPQVMIMLLDAGAEPRSVNMIRMDAFMFSCVFGRRENLQTWRKRIKDWDFNRQETVMGGCALGHALHIDTNNFDTVKYLLSLDVSLDYRTFRGSNALINSVSNEDSNPDVVRLVLEKLKSTQSAEEFHSVVNYRRKATTFRWKSIYSAAKILYRTGLSKSRLIRELAVKAGLNALNYAVMRGDIEIVRILLENGADPYIENDLGMSSLDICQTFGPYPRIKRVLLETTEDYK